MTQKKGAAEATPLKDKSKDTKFNSYIIDILIYIFFSRLVIFSELWEGLHYEDTGTQF